MLRAYEQWGHRCAEQLDGMFAFAVWDPRRRKSLLARDSFGFKPLFYALAACVAVRYYVVLRRKQLTDDDTADLPEPIQAGNFTPNQPPPGRLPHEIRSAIRNSAYQLANGTLDPDILAGIDYWPHLIEFGSQLEMAFAIFTNALVANREGRLTNQTEAQRRASQWIRAYCSLGYQIEPPLQDWETELI